MTDFGSDTQLQCPDDPVLGDVLLNLTLSSERILFPHRYMNNNNGYDDIPLVVNFIPNITKRQPKIMYDAWSRCIFVAFLVEKEKQLYLYSDCITVVQKNWT